MLSLSPATRVFLALAPIDGRKSFNGLYSAGQRDAANKSRLPAFCSSSLTKRRNRLKILRLGRVGPDTLYQTVGARNLCRSDRRGQECKPASGGFDAAHPRHREHLAAAVAPGVKIFPFWTGLRFFPDYLVGRDRESDHSGAAFKPGGAAEFAPVGGREPALEPVAPVAGVGHPLGLAQRRRSAQGHGRPHAVGEVGAAGADGLAGAAAGADQSDALRGPAGHGVAGAQRTDRWPVGPTGTAEPPGGQWPTRRAGLGQSGTGPLSLSGFWRRGGREPAICCPRWSEPPLGLPGVRSGGLEVPGPGPVYRLDGRATAKAPGAGGQQHAFSHLALGQGAGFGQLDPGAGRGPDRPGLAGQIWTSGGGVGDLRRAATFPGHGVSGGQLAAGGSHRRALAPGPAYLPAGAASKRFTSIRCGGAFGKPSAHEEPGRTTAGGGGPSGEVGGIYRRAPGATGSDRPELTAAQRDLQEKQQHWLRPNRTFSSRASI